MRYKRCAHGQFGRRGCKTRTSAAEAARTSRSLMSWLKPRPTKIGWSRNAKFCAIVRRKAACTNVQFSSSGNRSRGTRSAEQSPSYNLGSDLLRPSAPWDSCKYLAVNRIAQLSEAKRMALKATDIPAASPHVDAAGRTIPGSAGDPAPHPASASSHTPALNPEEQELARKREEQAAIESELAERELRSANLRAELGAFERQYLHHVGSRYAELDELKAAVAERLAHEQPANARAQQAAREARTRAAETQSTAGEKSEATPRAFESSPEMKRLYREVAKRVHPDLTSDRADRAKRQQLMAEANEAYERGDETKLRKIFTEYEWSAEAVQGEGPGAELIRVIRRISQARGRLAEIEAELQELLRSDLYQLKVRLDEAQSHGRDVLKEMVQKVEDQIAQAKRRLENPEGRGR